MRPKHLVERREIRIAAVRVHTDAVGSGEGVGQPRQFQKIKKKPPRRAAEVGEEEGKVAANRRRILVFAADAVKQKKSSPRVYT